MGDLCYLISLLYFIFLDFFFPILYFLLAFHIDLQMLFIYRHYVVIFCSTVIFLESILIFLDSKNLFLAALVFVAVS